MIYSGDEHLSHQQTNPEVYDQGSPTDPIEFPCEECNAEAGELCRPYCISRTA